MVPPVRSAKARAQAALALTLISRIVSNSAFFSRSASMSLLFSAMTLSFYVMAWSSSSIFRCIACSPHFLSKASMKAFINPTCYLIRSRLSSLPPVVRRRF